jgi:hypothetical protein
MPAGWEEKAAAAFTNIEPFFGFGRPCQPETLSSMSIPPTAKSDVSIYLLGSGLGICAGFIQVETGDLLFTALSVLIFTLVLGMVRPPSAWRWTLLVASFVPAMQLLAYLLLRQKPDRAQIYESFLVLLAGIAGAYGGAVAHRGWKELFGKGASGR